MENGSDRKAAFIAVLGDYKVQKKRKAGCMTVKWEKESGSSSVANNVAGLDW